MIDVVFARYVVAAPKAAKLLAFEHRSNIRLVV
jgi:hypothetical protein